MQKKHTLQEFLADIAIKNAYQFKYLENSLAGITPEEVLKFENLLNFYIQRENNTLEGIVDMYLDMIFMMVEEQKYFIEYGKYRYSTFSEVENYYRNSNYMSYYTIGLGLSVYLWRMHRSYSRLFDKALLLNNTTNRMGRYLEIGAGHGVYFSAAMQKSKYQKYTAVDISETSVKLTQDYVRYSIPHCDKNYEVIHENIFIYQPSELFDMVVMGEVLEHVENPNVFLRKIYELASDNAIVFITTAINAPQIDHIYQFGRMEEVTDLIKREQFEIIDFVAENANNMTLEKAEKRKVAINVGFILKKVLS